MSDNIVKLVFQASERGFAKVNGALRTCFTTCKQTVGACASLASSLASSGNAAGQAVGHIAQFVNAFAQLGAVGGIIAGVQILIGKISKSFTDAADQMVDAAKRVGSSVHEALSKLTSDHLDSVTAALEKATTEAQTAARAFDTLAAAYLKVADAKNATAKSGDDVAVSQLALERAEKMSGASTSEERALIGSQYDVRLAELREKNVAAAQEAAVGRARDDARAKAEQAAMARGVERDAMAALDKAIRERDLMDDAQSEALPLFEQKVRDAKKAYAEAVNSRTAKEAESEAAEEGVKQALNARKTAMNEARKAVVEASASEKELVRAQKEAAQAELERLRASATRAAAAKAGGEGAAETSAARIGGTFAEHFDLWRDPAAAQAAQDAAKQKSADLKAFYKAVNRTGGVYGKINEAAELMRSGDEEGLQARLDAWRKSSKFNGQTEEMVLAAAAKKNEQEDAAAVKDIRESTRNMEQTLAEIRAAFAEGSAE